MPYTSKQHKSKQQRAEDRRRKAKERRRAAAARKHRPVWKGSNRKNKGNPFPTTQKGKKSCNLFLFFFSLFWTSFVLSIVHGGKAYNEGRRLGDYEVKLVDVVPNFKWFNPQHSFTEIGSGCKITSKFIRNTTLNKISVEEHSWIPPNQTWPSIRRNYISTKMNYSCIGYTFIKIGVENKVYESCSEQNFSVGERVQCWQFSDEVIDADESLKSLNLKYHFNCDESPNYSPPSPPSMFSVNKESKRQRMEREGEGKPKPTSGISVSGPWDANARPYHRCKWPGSLRSDIWLWLGYLNRSYSMDTYPGKVLDYGEACIDEKKNLCMLLKRSSFISTTFRDSQGQNITNPDYEGCAAKKEKEKYKYQKCEPVFGAAPVLACNVSRAFDEANDECVRIDYPTEKAPQYYNAEVYYGHLFVFYVAVFFQLLSPWYCYIWVRCAKAREGDSCLLLICPCIWKKASFAADSTTVSSEVAVATVSSEVAATSGQVSIEMIEATQGKHHFEWHSPPRLVESPDNRLVIDDGDDGPWVKILQYADGPYKPTAKASGTLTCAFVQNGFAKLSDHEINSLAGNRYYLRFMSQNTKTYLYAHIKGLKFKDEECVFGYGDKKDYGLKVSSNFNAGDDFKYGRHGCRNGSKLCLDTTTNDATKMPVTGNDDQRWFADCQGKIAADWPSIYGVRAFNQGLPNAARRTQVSIWLKSPIVDDLFASQ